MATTALVAATLYAFGLLPASLHWAPHFGEASFNPGMLLTTPQSNVNPIHRWYDATGFQYEGYDYLGLGLVLLLVVVALSLPRAITQAVRRHVFLTLTLATLVAFAFSNRVYVGDRLLWRYELPSSVTTLVTQFRSTGRFVWPATYALLFFVVAKTMHLRYGPWMLGAATLLQVVDVAPHFDWVRDFIRGPDEVMLDPGAWSRVFERHQAVWTYPSFECTWMLRGRWEDSNHKALYQVSYQAALRGLTVNSIHNARPAADCLDDVRQRESVRVTEGTAYVLMRGIATGHALANLESQGAHCLAFERGYVCSTRLDAVDARAFEPLARAGRYVPGAWGLFGGDGSASAAIAGPGWGLRSADGALVGWPVEGPRTAVTFVLEPPQKRPDGGGVLELDLDTFAAQEPSALRIEMNGVFVKELVLEPQRHQTESVCIPVGLAGDGHWLGVDMSVSRVTESADDMSSPKPSPVQIRRMRLVEGQCASP
jgi:hypothetical protein